MRDCDAEQLENEWRQYVPQQPQVHPAMADFYKRNRAYLERHGVEGAKLIDMAHQYRKAASQTFANHSQQEPSGSTKNATNGYAIKFKHLKPK